jgi:hypothetical protein
MVLGVGRGDGSRDKGGRRGVVLECGTPGALGSGDFHKSDFSGGDGLLTDLVPFRMGTALMVDGRDGTAVQALRLAALATNFVRRDLRSGGRRLVGFVLPHVSRDMGHPFSCGLRVL